MNINIFYSRHIFDDINSKYKKIQNKFLKHFKDDLENTHQIFGKDLNKNAYSILDRYLPKYF